jgi:hypothetical protein
MKQILRSVRPAAALFAFLAFALSLAAGCESGMDPKECDKIRGEAFDLVNKAQHCNTDVDCRQSDWPGCAKPVSTASYDKIKAMHDPFTKGKCQEPKSDCREAPPVYCKQGLCVHREKGTPEGAGNTPPDQIIIK